MSTREPDEPQASPTFSQSFSAAARNAGIGKVAPGEAPSGKALLTAIGGVRGLIESILPGLGFIIVYTVTGELLPSVLAPLAVAVVFVLVRIVTRSAPTSAIAGVIGIGLSALLALWTGRAEDNFVLGFFINGISITVLAVSLIVRWPLIGVIVGLLTSDTGEWRKDKARFRVATIATVLWIGLFSLRLLVQLPLYFAGQAQWLAGTKLLMGVPLYAGLLWVTWLLVRTVYARPQPD
jgi:hypothetical protein